MLIRARNAPRSCSCSCAPALSSKARTRPAPKITTPKSVQRFLKMTRVGGRCRAVWYFEISWIMPAHLVERR
jgi:hypothetical protein